MPTTPAVWLDHGLGILYKRLPDGTVAEYGEDGELLGVFLDSAAERGDHEQR